MKILYIRAIVNGTNKNRTSLKTFFYSSLLAMFHALIGNCQCETGAEEQARKLISEIIEWQDDKEISGYGFNCKVVDLQNNREIPRLELIAYLSQNIEAIHKHEPIKK